MTPPRLMKLLTDLERFTAQIDDPDDRTTLFTVMKIIRDKHNKEKEITS